MKHNYKRISSPIGLLYIVATKTHLVGLTPESGWEKLKKRFENLHEEDNDILVKTQNQLKDYFDKKRFEFDIPLFFNGTKFQNAAWKALLQIPYGNTISYQEQAIGIGNPKAVRAIGGANGANPISIIVPCHRVIGKSGKLTGYASGLDIKKYLLELEK
ncbi:MAG: methylated-DNA--[protein]-cysteine S-methyltransferase [Sulfurospirillaceae bacterium]|nr:methylated-DNA--[protein]-cysteine S-methyltransferase [Sulfurospirillaceae bacterium]